MYQQNTVNMVSDVLYKSKVVTVQNITIPIQNFNTTKIEIDVLSKVKTAKMINHYPFVNYYKCECSLKNMHRLMLHDDTNWEHET